MVKEAIIIAGGMGKRMGNPDIPKWLTPIGDSTIAAFQLKWLYKQGIERVFVTLNECFKDRFSPGPLVVSWEERPIGDEGGLKKALGLLEGDEAIVINGDTLHELPLSLLSSSPAMVVGHPRAPWGVLQPKGSRLAPLPAPSPFVGLFAPLEAWSFVEKPILNELLVNLGVYRFPKSIRDELLDEGLIPEHIIPKLLSENRLHVVKWEGRWKGIDTPKDIEEAGKEWLL